MADLKENALVVRIPANIRCLDSAGNSGITPVKYINRFLRFGINGGQPITWFKLGSFTTNEYEPVLIHLRYGWFNTMDKNIDIVITTSDSTEYVSGTGFNVIGYIKTSNRSIDVYAKLEPAHLCVGYVFGFNENNISSSIEEPSGIKYIP